MNGRERRPKRFIVNEIGILLCYSSDFPISFILLTNIMYVIYKVLHIQERTGDVMLLDEHRELIQLSLCKVFFFRRCFANL